jgi:tetraacyldisaccharide 4'-kinase
VSIFQYFSFPRGLWAAQILYLIGQKFDRKRRSRSVFKSNIPVICIGNFQAGGTGKTPITQWVASKLKLLGYEPIIVLRGYKGITKASTLVNSQNARIYGDEAVLHALDHPTIVGKNRIESCHLAKTVAKTDKAVLILDDGLQYYELHKDFSIVCQKNRLFEYDTLLPQGRLREIPHTNIDAIISNGENTPSVFNREWNGIPDYYLKRKSMLKSGTKDPGIIVCGIAKANEFFDTVQKQLDFPGKEMKFRDHHRYSTANLARIEKASKKYEYRVHCTAKDAVKLEPLIEAENSPVKLSVWDIEIQPVSDVQPLLDAMVAKIEEVFKNRTGKQV